MDYRNDLEAARLRINTLEAKLEETKASLNARDAELAECRVERDKLRQRSEGKGPSRRAYIALAAGTLLLGAAIGFVGGTNSCPACPSAWETLPQATWPASKANPNHAQAEGSIQMPAEVPSMPPATVSGQTNLPAEEVTIDSIVQGLRPKVQTCYRAEAKTHPKASGSLKVVFDIDPTGHVIRTKLETMPYVDPWWSKTFETCIVEIYRPLQFPNQTGMKVTSSGQYFLSAMDLLDLGF